MPAVTAVAALGLCLSASTAGKALAGCAATTARHGWQYECTDLRASSDDRAEVGDAIERSVRTMLETAPTSVGRVALVRREERDLAGSAVEVFIVQPPGGSVAVLFAALPFGHGTRVLYCRGAPPRCDRVLRALAATPWRGENAPGSIRKDPPPLTIAGRAVPVPAGCRGSASLPGCGEITCAQADSARWGWTDDGAGAGDIKSVFDGAMRGAVPPGWSSTETQVPCRLAGVDTTCTRVIEASGRERALMMWAAVPDGRGVTFADCMAPGATPGRACAIVFEATGAR
jgi:hypothetical protein